MGKMFHFIDGNVACWSRVNLESGEPIWIGVAQTGILVKRSRMGLFGAKLYKETDIQEILDTITALDIPVEGFITPPGMTNPILRAFTQIALESDSASELCARIHKATGSA